MASDSERTWGAGAHLIPLVASILSLGFLGWVASIAVMVTKGRDSRFVRLHALQSMIFQILLMILAFIAFSLAGLLGVIPILGGLLAPLATWLVGALVLVAGIAVPILGAGRAKAGREYAIPIAAHIAKAIAG